MRLISDSKLVGLLLVLIVGIRIAAAQVPKEPTAEIRNGITAALKLPAKDVLAELDRLAARAKDIGDTIGEGQALLVAGKLLGSSKEFKQGLSYATKALALFKSAGAEKGEADALTVEGQAEFGLHDDKSGLDSWLSAIHKYSELGLLVNAATVQHGLGLIYRRMGRYPLALEVDLPALKTFRDLKLQGQSADAENSVGIDQSLLGHQESALEHFQLCLAAYRELKALREVPRVENNIGRAYGLMEQNDKAIEHYTLALQGYRDIGSPADAAGTQMNLGLAYTHLGKWDTALAILTEALQAVQKLGMLQMAATALQNIGSVYEAKGNPTKALEFYSSALSGYREQHMLKGVADIENNIANLYSNTRQNEKALVSYNLALKDYAALPLPSAVAGVQGNIAVIYENLGQPDTALVYCALAIKTYRDLPYPRGVADQQVTMGLVYQARHDSNKALEYMNMALAAYRSQHLPLFVGRTQLNIGNTYLELGRTHAAMSCFQDALKTFEQQDLPNLAADAEFAIGQVALERKQYPRALNCFESALPRIRASGDRESEALLLSETAKALAAQGHRRIAIEAGKLAVGLYQSLRSDIKGLDAGAQSSYRNRHSVAYREVAGLLIDEGRLAEAQRILDLLKDEEFRRFARAAADQKVDLTRMETTWKAKFDEMERTIDADESELEKANAAIRTAAHPTAVQIETQRRAQANVRLRAEAVKAWLDAAETAFSAQGVKPDPIVAIRSSRTGLMSTLGRLPQRTAGVYTLESADGVRTLLTLPRAQAIVKGRAQAISAVELNRMIAEFRVAVTNPAIDPRPLGAALYEILVRPLERQLEAHRTQAIVWSLDGSLRYLPLAALYDSRKKQYLIQKYPCSLFVPALEGALKDDPAPITTALGFGVTHATRVRDLDFAALPGVKGELDRLKSNYRAQLFMDKDFTAPKFIALLGERPNLVHLGTHFQLRPGDEEGSFLVLGDGTAFSAKAFIELSDTKAFSGVDLLVLSACDTATPIDDNADGGETESFARIALEGGAAAVLATLWPVDDPSTSRLMGKFYGLRKAGLGKLAALRQAQLWLMGTAGATGPIRAEIAGPRPTKGLPRFKPDSAHPFSHPYFWAPFVLTGNAR